MCTVFYVVLVEQSIASYQFLHCFHSHYQLVFFLFSFFSLNQDELLFIVGLIDLKMWLTGLGAAISRSL